MKTIDLHTHSYCSDGADSPSDVVRCAHAAGLSAIALSDHDSTDGVEEAMAAGARLGVEVLPAVELSAEFDTELHILGYGIDIHAPRLKEALAEARRVREVRQEDMCRKLREQGFAVTMDEVRAETGEHGVLCRAHFAQILVRKGYAASVQDAFARYLSAGCYAYSKKQALSPAEAVSLIRDAGGVAAVAHLHLIKLPDEPLKALLSSLIPHGLSGVEGYYTDYTPEMARRYRAMAQDLGLILTGGTDYHGKNKPHIEIGRGRGDLFVPYDLLHGIRARCASIKTENG